VADWVKNLLQVDPHTEKATVDAFFASIASKGEFPDEEFDLLIDFQKIEPVKCDDSNNDELLWRDTRIMALGTKGVNYSGQHRRDGHTIVFETATTGVPILIRHLSRLRPEVKLCYVCELCDVFNLSHSIGTFIFQGGDVLVDHCYNRGTETYERFMRFLYDEEFYHAEGEESDTKYFESVEAEKERKFAKLVRTCIEPHGIRLEELNLSVRSYNCLKRAGINTVGDILALTRAELLHVRNFNEKCVTEVEGKLDKFGLHLKE
jgi:hypothetical protein